MSTPENTATADPTTRSITGFFGKLPGRGDFIGRHLPKSFIDPWDAWLQAAIARSRIALGGSWRECYCTSPIWRFALSAGLCGPDSYAGILMPSVDRVGRYYPLVIAVPMVPVRSLFALPLLAEPWFHQAEQLALAGLDLDRLDVDAFSQQVAALGEPPIPHRTISAVANDPCWYCPLPDSLPMSVLAATMADMLLQQCFPQTSLWWTEGSERIARCLLVCDGLPPASGFAALLAGEWGQSGWNEKQFAGFVSHLGENRPPPRKSNND